LSWAIIIFKKSSLPRALFALDVVVVVVPLPVACTALESLMAQLLVVPFPFTQKY
jgi:hypothetical protein